METQPITYDGRCAAIATAHDVVFSPHIGELPPTDPLRRFVSVMAHFAQELLRGRREDFALTYDDDLARGFAVRVLVADPEAIDRSTLDTSAAARRYGVPERELIELLLQSS